MMKPIIAYRQQALDHAWRHVQAARFQYARHQRHARGVVVGGFLGHFPQAVVRVEIAVGVAQLGESFREHGEVASFVVRAAGPVAVVFERFVAKTVDRIPGEIDGVELDMRHGMHECGAAFGGTQAAMRYLSLRHQVRTLGTAWRADGLGRG